jgi:hypothetical protein
MSATAPASTSARTRSAPAPGDHDHAPPGLVALEESLARLVREQLVEHKDALSRAAHPEEFERAVTEADRAALACSSGVGPML